MTTNLKEIEKVVEEFGGDIEKIDKALRALSSRKTNLKKAKYQPGYDEKMAEILARFQVLNEAKALLKPKKKFVTDFEADDIALLDYDETMKAIKSIQSKKFHTRWLTAVEGDNDEYRNACRIEAMLLEHKDQVKPVEEIYIRKSDLVAVIDTIESSGDLSQERIVELLKGLI